MIQTEKFFTLAVTAFLATSVFAITPAKALQSGSLLATAAAVPGSSCGWKTVKRGNGSTALELDREKWLSKACESDREKYRIVPTAAAAQSNPIHIGCDYRIFTSDSSDGSLNAQRRTDDLNRQCLAETARMKQQFEDKKELHRQKKQEVDEAQREAETAHKSVVATQREMKAAYDEAMTAHRAENWPVFRGKMEEYENKMQQHQMANGTYNRLLAAYESLIASLV